MVFVELLQLWMSRLLILDDLHQIDAIDLFKEPQFGLSRSVESWRENGEKSFPERHLPIMPCTGSE